MKAIATTSDSTSTRMCLQTGRRAAFALAVLSVLGCKPEVRKVTLGIASAAFSCNPENRAGYNLLEWARESGTDEQGNHDDSYAIFDLFQVPDAVFENEGLSCLSDKMALECDSLETCPFAAESVCVRIDGSIVEQQIALLPGHASGEALALPALSDLLAGQG